MQKRDSILTQPFALIALAAATMSTPLGAQTVGDRVRVFSGSTTIVGRITSLNGEGFELANNDLHQSFAYRDLDRLEVVGGIKTWGHEGAVIGSVAGALGGLGGELNAFEGSLMGGLLGSGIGAVVPFVAALDLNDSWFRDPRRSWKPVSVRDYFVPLLGEEFPYGGRVRVSADGKEIIGRATAITDEGFELVQGGTRQSFAYRNIDGVEWSRGIRSRWKTGWGLGLLGGFIAFPTFNGAWGCVASDWEGPSCEEKGRDMLAWIGAGGLLGLGVGTLAWRRESWEAFALQDNSLGISPTVASRLLGTGDRVRLTIAGERTIGEVARMGPDGYEIDIEGSGLVSVRLSEMEQLQRSIGMGTRWVEGLLIGGAVGLAIGVAIGDAREDDGGDIDLAEIIPGAPTGLPEMSADDGGFPIEAVSGAVGVAAGLGVGSLLKKERWVTIWNPPDRGTDMTFNPVINVRSGRDGRLAAVLGGRIRF